MAQNRQAKELAQNSNVLRRMGGGALDIAFSPLGLSSLNIAAQQDTMWKLSTQHMKDAGFFQKMGAQFTGGGPEGKAALRSALGKGTMGRLVGGIGELASPISVGLAAYDLATVHKLPEEQRLGYLASSGIGHLGGVAAYTGGFAVGAMTVPVVGWIAAAGIMIGSAVGGHYVGKAINQISEIGARARRLELGGDFRDTQDLATMRMRSLQEMSGSLLNARQYFGNEAAFFHG